MPRSVSLPLAVLLLCALALLLLRPALAADPAIRLEPFVRGLAHPVYLISDGTERLFIVEQRGVIRLVIDGQLQRTPYLDIKDRVYEQGELGLLCVVFHPRFAENGYLYVNYTTRRPWKTIVSEFRADPASQRVDPSTERIILTIDQPYNNHNGGQLVFGPDGMLYIGMGDGGSGDDPKNYAQNPRSLLGKMLRIDVNDRNPYGIPKDNPFVGRSEVRPEIWATGLRNPWRFSFDRETGDCYAGDVGQNRWEEIDIIVKGGNYGWRPREGFHQNPKLPNERVQGEYIDPIHEYSHQNLDLSITGGYVYRGTKHPSLLGWYFYADYASGRVWALRYEDGTVKKNLELLGADARLTPSSFGEDKDGELYICAHEHGIIYRIVAK